MMEAFLEPGYRAPSFVDADPCEKHLLLRRDLDMTVQAALPLTETEHDLGFVPIL